MKITKAQLRRIIAEEVADMLHPDQSTPTPEVCAACGGTGLRAGHGDTMSWREIPALCDVCRGAGKTSRAIGQVDESLHDEGLRLNEEDGTAFYKKKAGKLREVIKLLSAAQGVIDDLKDDERSTTMGEDPDLDALAELVYDAEGMAMGLEDAVRAMVAMGEA